MITRPGREMHLVGELHVGSRRILESAGFTEVSHPTLRRVVMRIDFEQALEFDQDTPARIRSSSAKQPWGS